jgi:hypothetical protein
MDKDMQPVITVNKFGDKFWKLNDRFHRTDGPAIEWSTVNYGKEWFLFGIPYLFDDWLDQTPGLTNKQKTLYRIQYG